MHARERIGSGSIPIIVLFSTPRGSLHIPTLAGRNIRLIAQRLCLPHREFHPRQKIYCIGFDRGKWPAGSPILFLREPESPNGPSLMSQFVVMFSSMTTYSQYLPLAV